MSGARSRNLNFRVLIVCAPLLLCMLPASAQTIKACGGDNFWPPMSFIRKQEQRVDGISPTVLRLLFPQIEIELRPWARCLAEVSAKTELGTNGFDIVMSIFKSPEREKNYLFSRPYHHLTPAYLYLKKRYAQAPITSLADLRKYKVCSLYGAITGYTQLDPKMIDSGAHTYLSLLRKLEYARCDVVIDMREVLLGFADINVLPFDDERFQIQDLPGTNPYPVHFAMSRQHAAAQATLEQIDQHILQLQNNGKLQKIIARYQ